MNTLIIPCGGRSSRFPNMRPKYLLTHPDGCLMIHHAIKGLNFDIFDRIVITVIKRHAEDHDACLWLSQAFSGNEKVEICVLDDFTESASETVALTAQKMNITGSIVSKDCDNFVTVDIPNPITNSIVGYNLGQHPDITNVPGKSFLIINEQNIVQDIIEKKIVSETICLGVYAFADIVEFIEAYQEILDKRVQAELFLSHVISYMINRKGAVFEALLANEYQDWGTISEWKNIQKNMRTYFIDVDGVIMENSGKYGRTNWGNNTAMLKNNVAVVKKLQAAGGQIIITTTRAEEYRSTLEKMLEDAGIKPHAIITGLNHAARVLINDFSPTNPYPSARSISLPRNGNLQEYLE